MEGVDVEELKKRRTAAQTAFTRRANQVADNVDTASLAELVNDKKALQVEFAKLVDTTGDYIGALEEADGTAHATVMADATAKKDGSKQRKMTLEKKIFSEVWSRFVQPKLGPLEAEFKEALEEAKRLSIQWAPQDKRALEGNKLERRLNAFEQMMREWRYLLPTPNISELEKRYRHLDEERAALMDKWSTLLEPRGKGDNGCAYEGEEDRRTHNIERGGDVTGPLDISNDVSQRVAEAKPSPSTNSKGEVLHIHSSSPQLDSSQIEGASKDSPLPFGSHEGAPKETHLQLGAETTRSRPHEYTDRSSLPRVRQPGSEPYLYQSADLAIMPQLRGDHATPSGDEGATREGLAHHRAYQGARPKIKLAAINLPRFCGDRRTYWRWRDNWEDLQALAEPSGLPVCKLYHLLDSVEEPLRKKLGLDRCRTADDVFRLLDNRFGDRSTTASLILKGLEEVPPVRSNQPRPMIDLVQAVETALYDLKDLGMEDVIKNHLTVAAIERKLPIGMREKWISYERDPANGVTPASYFDRLLSFLKGQERILERLAQLEIGATHAGERPTQRERLSDRGGDRRSFTRTTASEVRREPQRDSCTMCGEEAHGKRLYFCPAFKKAKLLEKRAQVKKAGACFKCLAYHGANGPCEKRFLCKKDECVKGGGPVNHHFLLCSKTQSRNETTNEPGARKGLRGLTAEQEKVVTELKLSTLQMEAFKKAFTNRATSQVYASKSLLDKSGIKEYPVLMMLMDVTTRGGDCVGALMDLASDTNYITHRAAKRLGLAGEPITLVVYGVGKMAVRVDTKRYVVAIKVWTPKGTLRAHEMLCYGLEDIAKVDRVVNSERLEKFFPCVKPGELTRPDTIDLLISTREGRLAPQRMERAGDLVLWDGPLGKTVSGAHPDLFEEVKMTTRHSLTHFARSMGTTIKRRYEDLTVDLTKRKSMKEAVTATSNKEVFDWLKWDSIGAACDPICGGCRCGNCPPGGKEMTLADERELEIIKAGLTFKEKDSHCGDSHWDAKYPWKEQPGSLPNNRRAVESTFFRTEKRLEKDLSWKTAYTRQIHEMVERGAAVKLTRSMMDQWKGAVWYVSHLTAPNPHSVTTPVRIVWDSSQEYRGVSMNNILLKGPDVLNQIRAVLLRFREGEHAAIGDIKKMYNSVWLEEEEVHVHRFLWRDSPQDEIEDYAVVRVNMGDKPAGCIAQVAMRETAYLPRFSHLTEERSVIVDNSYVDDLLVSHNDSHRLEKILKGVEVILKAGGFHLKPWVRSGHSGRHDTPEAKPETLVLPNQLKEEDNKALGVGYLVQEDKLFVMASINFSRRRQKMRMEADLAEENIIERTPNPLTRRVLLSQVAGLYDPIGLATPLKQKGVILVRRAFQEAGKITKDTWDQPLSEELREKAVELFKEYARLSRVTFPRSITPAGWLGKPWGITFSDGSCDSYGAVLYLRWETSGGAVARLVESKAKLAPLDLRGDPVKAEICGAVFASRLKKYVLKHGRIKIERWFHFVDSQTVLGAIQRESYGFQTFFANRVGEIQKAGPVTDWWWVPGERNIADLVTRGHCSPELLGENSAWQCGPDFLAYPEEEWPMKSASEVSTAARDAVSRLQRKAFTVAITRAQAKTMLPLASSEEGKKPATKEESDIIISPNRSPDKLWGGALVGQINPRRYSSLKTLCNVVGFIRRALKFWVTVKTRKAQTTKARSPTHTVLKWEALTVNELQSAFRELCLAAQEGAEFPVTTLDRLVVHKEEDSKLLLCHGRVQAMAKEWPGVPLLPYREWVSILLAEEAHRANHEGIAGTLLRMRDKAWVVQGPRVARSTIDLCIHCRKNKAKMCRQIMSELPPERTEPAAPFEYTTLDLFGPYRIKDSVKKRTSKKAWGVVFCCMASRAIHADIVEDLSTEGFLKTFQRFTALRGHPKKLWSDKGTNFVGAKPALEELYKFLANIDNNKIQKKAAESGTDWTWVFHPADSPHRNGAAEAAVRVLKRALSSIGEEGSLTALEFQTLLYLAANLSNERPIGANAQLRDGTIEVITPNTLLLGRARPRGDPGGFESASYPFVRLRAIQIEVDRFWKRWSQLAGPELFVRKKWHTPARNVTEGDLVWLADQNALRGQFRLGRVIQTHPDPKGVIRDVEVRTCHSLPVTAGHPKRDRHVGVCPTTVLHRDVRRLVVLLPIEEQ